MTPNRGSSSTTGTPPTNRPRSANQAPALPIQFAGLPPAAVWIAASVPSWVRKARVRNRVNRPSATAAAITSDRAMLWRKRVRQSAFAVEIGRAHVWTPVTNAHLVCRLLLENKKPQQLKTHHQARTKD